MGIVAKLFAFFALAIGFSLSAAEPKGFPLETAMRSATGAQLKLLKEEGFTAIGKKSIDELIKRTAQTKWNYLPAFLIAGRDEKRMTGSSSFEENTIFLGLPFIESCQQLKAVASSPMNVFAFHESCFANGVEDTNYSTAFSVAYITFLKDSVPSEEISKIFRDHLNKVATYKSNPLLAREGRGGGVHGGTGVNGGGDIAAVDLKYKLISGWVFQLQSPEVQELYNMTSTEALEKVLSLDVVISYEASGFSVSKNNAGIYQIKFAHNDWFARNPHERYNFQMKILSLLSYAMGNLKAETTDPYTRDDKPEAFLKALLSSKLTDAIYELSPDEIKKRVASLKVQLVTDSSFSLTQDKNGAYSLKISKDEWLNNRPFIYKVIAVLVDAMGDINYEKYGTKK